MGFHDSFQWSLAMTATHNTNCTASNAHMLYLALELGVTNWKPAFTVGLGQ
jgi:hypothetical protein